MATTGCTTPRWQRGGPEEAQPGRRGPPEHHTRRRGGTVQVHAVKEVAGRTGLELLTGDDTALRAAGGTRRRETAPRRLHLGPGQPDANCRDDEKPASGEDPVPRAGTRCLPRGDTGSGRHAGDAGEDRPLRRAAPGAPGHAGVCARENDRANRAVAVRPSRIADRYAMARVLGSPAGRVPGSRSPGRPFSRCGRRRRS